VTQTNSSSVKHDLCFHVGCLSPTFLMTLTLCVILQAKFVNVSLLLLIRLSEQSIKPPLVSVVCCVSFCLQSSWVLSL